MAKVLRIAVARIQQESNEFSSLETTLADFQRTHFLEGDALLQAIKPSGKEAEGFMKNAELSGFFKGVQDKKSQCQIEIVPLFSAWAVSGGPLSEETHRQFEARLMRDLASAGPLDGVFLAMHGALRATGIPNPEEEYLQAVRTAVGPEVPVAVTLDLHAHLRAEVVALADVLCAYRTNPHRDHAKVGARAAGILIDAILGKITVAKTWRHLPMIMGGGSTIDFLPTMFPVFSTTQKNRRGPKSFVREPVYGSPVSRFARFRLGGARHDGWGSRVGQPDRRRSRRFGVVGSGQDAPSVFAAGAGHGQGP